MLRAINTGAYLSTTSAWTPYVFCSTAFWKDIRVFSGANWDRKSNGRLAESRHVYKAASVRVLRRRHRKIREPKQLCFIDYMLASYTGVPASPTQNWSLRMIPLMVFHTQGGGQWRVIIACNVRNSVIPRSVTKLVYETFAHRRGPQTGLLRAHKVIVNLMLILYPQIEVPKTSQ